MHSVACFYDTNDSPIQKRTNKTFILKFIVNFHHFFEMFEENVKEGFGLFSFEKILYNWIIRNVLTLVRNSQLKPLKCSYISGIISLNGRLYDI